MPVKAKDWSKQINKALESIADGESVTKSCEKAGITKANFLKLVDGDRYARARDAQADAQFADMDDKERECLNGKIDPQVFRAAMDVRKWRLARMHPVRYGDRAQVDHNVTASLVMSAEACEESARAARDRLAELRAARKKDARAE